MIAPSAKPDSAPGMDEYRAKLVLEVSKAVNAHLELGEVLDALSAALHPCIHFDAIGVSIIKDGQLRLYSIHIHDVPRNPGESVASHVARSKRLPENGGHEPLMVHFRVEDSCLEELQRTGKPYVANDLLIDRRFPIDDYYLRKDIRAYICLALRKRDQMIGAVHYVSKLPRRFAAHELQVLEDASEIVSIAVSNAMAYEEIKTLKERLQAENRILQDEIDQSSMFEEIVGSSGSLLRVLADVERVAPTDSTVLITGETGTGKELVARAIHRRSDRAKRAFVKVNCAALPAELIASELFGHEKGAFTGALQQRIGRFEAADGGTIFLDEIGELSGEMQVSLLRVLQEREFERVGGNRSIHVDVRVIAATNRDLAQEVAEGRFRSDLYYRLNVFPVHCPSLRQRKDDIPVLVDYFAARFANRMGKRIQGIDNRTAISLLEYSWPGNIRELQNVIERAVILAEEGTLRLGPDALPREPQRSLSVVPAASPAHEGSQRSQIESILRETRGKISGPNGAARRLGIPASTLESRIRSLGINKHLFRAS